jgi:hypothetical protein
VVGALLCHGLIACGPASASGADASGSNPSAPPISLEETITPTALIDLDGGDVPIVGTLANSAVTRVLVRVTGSLGETSQNTIAAVQGRFRCQYPKDFKTGAAVAPGVLFIDATDDVDFDVEKPGHLQAEATVIVYDSRKRLAPRLPSVLTADLLDAEGRADRDFDEWPVVRSLANLYMRSRAAHCVHVGRAGFDLANAADQSWFKDNLALYDFDHRDRDWSLPLGHRVARTFWKSVWNSWFNASNDHPLDGNPSHTARTNYLPYAFANDFADLLVMTAMQKRMSPPPEGHFAVVCREAAGNLLAMQHRAPGNFALPDTRGRSEVYTAGAFRYGLFSDGEFLVEGKGWFYNPARRDYADGGVLNGRAVWGLGESLRQDPRGPLAPQLKVAMALALKFCLHDGSEGGYTKTTSRGNACWRDAGEHAYLLLGMVAACDVAPDLPVALSQDEPAVALRDLCPRALNALVDLEQPSHQWSVYPNVDAMAVAALAEGIRLLPGSPDVPRWRDTAIRVADAWLAAEVDPKEWSGPVVHFGLLTAPGRMTYVWERGGHARIFLYQTGHWIHALADLYAVTGSSRYRERAEAMVRYLCGANPWQLRLFNELGAVYNWTDDTHGDGVQDLLKQDMYPESTAFCQIGIMRLTQTVAEAGRGR